MSHAETTFRQICLQAETYPDITTSISCNQQAYKTAKRAYLYIGPGPKGKGYKAMFTLKQSIPEATELSQVQPTQFQLGKGGRLSVWFDDDNPLEQKDWSRWLLESYQLAI